MEAMEICSGRDFGIIISESSIISGLKEGYVEVWASAIAER